MMTMKPFIIISANLASNSDTMNKMATDRLKVALINLQHKEVEGTYQGIKEVGFLLSATSTTTLEPLGKVIAHEFNQEAYLLVDANGLGVLKFTEGQSVELGKMKVSSTKPIEGDYTKVDNYYLSFNN